MGWHLIQTVGGMVILTGCLVNEGKGIPGGENSLSKNAMARTSPGMVCNSLI